MKDWTLRALTHAALFVAPVPLMMAGSIWVPRPDAEMAFLAKAVTLGTRDDGVAIRKAHVTVSFDRCAIASVTYADGKDGMLAVWIRDGRWRVDPHHHHLDRDSWPNERDCLDIAEAAAAGRP